MSDMLKIQEHLDIFAPSICKGCIDVHEGGCALYDMSDYIKYLRENKDRKRVESLMKCLDELQCNIERWQAELLGL